MRGSFWVIAAKASMLLGIFSTVLGLRLVIEFLVYGELRSGLVGSFIGGLLVAALYNALLHHTSIGGK